MNYKEFLTAAGVPPELHPEALAALKRAREQSKKVVPYKRWAPSSYGMGSSSPTLGGRKLA